MNEYLTVNGKSLGEITVSRSRFIAVAQHIETEEEAINFISSKRAEHHDARHNVYAFRLANGVSRFSDDGEPHSTAGKPVFDVLCGAGLFNTLVVVTRYFGGVLLGTGGLVRAYSSAADIAINNSEIVKMTECVRGHIDCTYSSLEILKTLLSSLNCKISDIKYADNVTVFYTVESKNFDFAAETVFDKFSSKVQMMADEKIFCAF